MKRIQRGLITTVLALAWGCGGANEPSGGVAGSTGATSSGGATGGDLLFHGRAPVTSPATQRGSEESQEQRAPTLAGTCEDGLLLRSLASQQQRLHGAG